MLDVYNKIELVLMNLGYKIFVINGNNMYKYYILKFYF